MKSFPLRPEAPPFRRSASAILLAGILGVLGHGSAPGCGPEFPNWLLAEGDAALVESPVASFKQELARLPLPPARHASSPGSGSHEQDTLDAEMADLGTALAAAGRTESEVRQAGQQLAAFRTAARAEGATTHPEFPPGLPGEFADYLQGAEAWWQGNPAAARDHWARLLKRPAGERRFRSTWAAYMLGRAATTNEWKQALERYQEVRTLAEAGFVDRLGLAAASYGWEARVHLDRREFLEAIRLYLQQYAANREGSAVQSLAQTARDALQHGTPEELARVAADPQARRVVGAWLVSREPYPMDREADGDAPGTAAAKWLSAVERSDAKDLHTAEQLALAAYQAGDMRAAARWVARAPSSPAVQWVNAKLWLRAGKLDKAAATLSRIVTAFPAPPPADGTTPPGTFEQGLSAGNDPAHRRVLGELGALRLARREYVQALDALLRAGFWMDAAFVAERVLSLDELQRYVDQNWPVTLLSSSEEPPQGGPADEDSDRIRCRQIRHLLGRRLVRNNRGMEAGPYMPAEVQSPLATVIEALQRAGDETLPAPGRADAWWEAAKATRTHGLEVMGTEVGPDWAIHGGDYEEGVTPGDRLRTNQVARASRDEAARIDRHVPAPDSRFHYRHVAAAMAWQAAQLLPDNNDEKARILCRAGSWLKVRDPQAADVYYKALVRTCRKTAIGRQADEMRWFPVLDAEGRPIPWRRPVEPEVDASEPTPEPGTVDPSMEETTPPSDTETSR